MDQPVFEFDSLLQPEFARAPQPYYRQMRDTNPVLRLPDMYGSERTNVFVAKHSDIEHVLRHPELFSSDFLPAEAAPFPMIPENIDPPDHKKYRRLLDPLFGPKPMKQLEPDMIRRANELVDRFIERGECDFAQEFAVPLPCGVFLDLMGLPSDELDFFLQLKHDFLHGQEVSNEFLLHAKERANERFRRLISERRRAPRDDLITHLVNATIEDKPLTEEELLGICHLMVVAGLDTVTDSLTCFHAWLARHPEQRRRIVEDPAIIPAAIEELLRFESPVPFVPRIVTEDLELSGCPLKAGNQIVCLIGSANTDERVHERADVVDFDRDVNRHFGFGGGIHRCLGSHLARLELRVALGEWHQRIPDYRTPDGVELEYTPLLRHVEHLPLVFDHVPRWTRTALLTSAGGGLGTASTIELTRRGSNVIAAVRSTDDEFAPLLDATAGDPGDVQPLLLDLLDDASIAAAAEQLAGVTLDAVVHNAGVGSFATFEDTPAEEWKAIFQVNLLGPMRLTALLLPSMRARGSGRIVAVSSYTARLGVPFASVYGASKAGLERWIETLAVELKAFGITAHALEAGMFDTPMVNGPKPPQNPDSPYRRVYDRLEPYRERMIATAKPPAHFATVLADTLDAKNPPLLRPVGADAYWLYAAQRLLPSRLIPALFRLAFRPDRRHRLGGSHQSR